MKWVWTAVGACAGLLAYGAVYEIDRLTAVRRRLDLEGWPSHLDGFRIGFLSDLHVGDRTTMAMTLAALEWLKEESPDIVVFGGDFVHTWTPDSLEMLRFCLGGVRDFRCPVVGVAGNHDYCGGCVSEGMAAIDSCGVTLLRNECVVAGGVQFVGIDSAVAGRDDSGRAFSFAQPDSPTVVVWHEPDMADSLPVRAHLMLSGHSHGGQFKSPWGWAPAAPRLGRKYLEGFFGHLSTPLYVSRGIGTTGPPSRMCCPPEVAVLSLFGTKT